MSRVDTNEVSRRYLMAEQSIQSMLGTQPDYNLVGHHFKIGFGCLITFLFALISGLFGVDYYQGDLKLEQMLIGTCIFGLLSIGSAVLTILFFRNFCIKRRMVRG